MYLLNDRLPWNLSINSSLFQSENPKILLKNSKFENVSVFMMLLSFQATPTGLYICMQSFLGFGKDFVLPYSQQTNRHIFLHLQREKIPVSFNKLMIGVLTSE